jgi:hypothetical protein
MDADDADNAQMPQKRSGNHFVKKLFAPRDDS